jgi:hypothetical protein
MICYELKIFIAIVALCTALFLNWSIIPSLRFELLHLCVNDDRETYFGEKWVLGLALFVKFCNWRFSELH